MRFSRACEAGLGGTEGSNGQIAVCSAGKWRSEGRMVAVGWPLLPRGVRLALLGASEKDDKAPVGRHDITHLQGWVVHCSF